MTLNTGWTPEITPQEKARNVIARLTEIVGHEAAKECATDILLKHGAATGAYVDELDCVTRAAEDMQRKAQSNQCFPKSTASTST